MAADSDDPQVVELFDRLHRGINAAMRARGSTLTMGGASIASCERWRW